MARYVAICLTVVGLSLFVRGFFISRPIDSTVNRSVTFEEYEKDLDRLRPQEFRFNHSLPLPLPRYKKLVMYVLDALRYVASYVDMTLCSPTKDLSRKCFIINCQYCQ